MHNAGYRHLKLPFFYAAFDTEDTGAALDAMELLGFRGLSLTIPHKERALPYVKSFSQEAKLIGAVNTVVNSGQGLIGHNTDWTGIAEAFREARVQVKEKRVFVFGAGGAARASVYAVQRLGAAEITVGNRSEQRGGEIAHAFGVSFCPLAEIDQRFLGEFDIFINATPIGSHLGPKEEGIFRQAHLADADKFSYPFALSFIGPKQTVFDLVTRDTQLLEYAKEKGAATISGLRMLLWQAVEQFRLFTEAEAPVAVLEKALYDEISGV